MADKEENRKKLKNKSGEFRRIIKSRSRSKKQKKTKKPLEIEHRQLLSIFDSIDEVVYISDPDTYEILYANQSVKKDFGNVVGKKCYIVFQGMESPCSFCSNKYIFGKNLGKSYIWEFRNRNNNRWYHCIDKAINWTNGKMVRYEMAIDITERKLVEHILQESEAKYRDLYDNAPDMYHTLDKNGVIIDCNETEAKMLGYKKEEIIGRPLSDFFTEESRRFFERDFPRLNYKKAQVRVEREFVRKDGTTFPASLNVFSEFDEKGELSRTRTIARDITELRRSEEALRESEKKYRTLFEESRDAIYITSRDGRFLDFNRSTMDLLGYSREELKNINVLDIYVNSEERHGFQQAIEKEGYVRDYAIKFRKKDGTEITCLLNSTLRCDADGKILGYQGIIRDITEKQKIEEELLKAQRLESIGFLAGGIAHDFNNILTAVLGNIAIAAMYAKPGSELFERLVEAEKASMRAKDLTQQLLTFSKGGAPLKKAASIAEILRESAGLALRGSNVGCEFFLPDNLWPVEVDEGQISQVINNLVINADQAMPRGGKIRIFADNVIIGDDNVLPVQKGKSVKITIKDRGIGIPREHIQKIFDPYFTTKQKGNGLGLAVTYSIIKKHDGYITVESELGKGTVFHIYLPASEKKIDVKKVTREEPIRGKGKVLLMDDEEIVRGVCGEILRQIGYDFEYARDGKEAIELYVKSMRSGKPFDAVIMDLTVPGGMGGKETIQKLLEIDPGIKAIVSSGYSYDPVMADFRRFGFSEVIAKPYKLVELSEVLYKVINSEKDR
ncbi:MAG: PAS domain S-box protein [Nitrospirota bacterium]